MEPHLEWFFLLAGVPENFARYGGKGGSFGPQNVCNFSSFVESLVDGEQIFVSTFVRDSLHSCGFGLSARTFIEQMALDPAFRALVQSDEGWDDLLFRIVCENRLAVMRAVREKATPNFSPTYQDPGFNRMHWGTAGDNDGLSEELF